MKKYLSMIILLAAVCWSSSVAAEPVTFGTLTGTFPQSGVAIELGGDGFAFSGIASPWMGVSGLLDCLMPYCTQGATVSLDSRWSGGDLPGTFAYLGESYQTGLEHQMSAAWFGSLFIPTSFDGGWLAAPFAFTGRFSSATVSLDLEGSGLASVQFFRKPDGSFGVSESRYQMESTPNPEPMTMLLTSSGLIALYRMGRRKQR